jgi:hypothetical protein
MHDAFRNARFLCDASAGEATHPVTSEHAFCGVEQQLSRVREVDPGRQRLLLTRIVSPVDGR